MSYTVLARKYRSQTFDEVVGQEPIAQTLRNAIKTDRVAHAYLFTGTRGIGKTTMARVLAKALNCLSTDGPTSEPCCKCESCIAINLGDDIDVIEIDGASNRGIENIRELRQNVIYAPARARFKIYIIDEVHMLTTEAFNALLKTLEEPPGHVKFIFATTEPNKVIPTIQSRCQRFDFNNISAKAIAGQLKKILKQEKIKFDQDVALLLARMANGSMRDSLSLLDRLLSTGQQPLTVALFEEFLGTSGSEKVYELVEKIGDSDAAATLDAVAELVRGGLSEVLIVDAIIDCMRDLMVVKSAGIDSQLLILTEQQRNKVGLLADKFDVAAFVYNITALEKLRWTIKNSDTPRALLEASVLRFALSEHFLNVDALLSQLGSAEVKKKQMIRPVAPEPTATEPTATESPLETLPELPQLSNIESVKSNWQSILSAIATELGKGTAVLLTAAEPAEFEQGLLTVRFDAGARTKKEMCESNGRADKIQTLLAKYCRGLTGLKFEISNDNEQANTAGQSKTSGQIKKEIMNDPAVKTVITGLDATITNVVPDE